MSAIKGKVILITGATSGLGKVAAINLAAKGAQVIATSRDTARGQELVDEFNLHQSSENGSIELITCDLSSLQSIKVACGNLISKYDKIDMIVNNAGTWNFAFTETEDGIENTFQVNLLAPTLITKLLLPLIQKSDEPKVINTASGLHQGNISFKDIEYRNNFNGFKSYRQSKLGVILLTRLYQKKYEQLGINFYAQHPGLVNTGLVRKGGWFSKLFFKIFGLSPEKGAKTLTYLMLTPTSDLKNGEYYANRKVKKTDTKESYNLEIAEQLESVCDKYLEKYL
jgi:NAD(P)-dependent dehydrogenase (short-subunit alcohol dehydrogenase family)